MADKGGRYNALRGDTGFENGIGLTEVTFSAGGE